MRKLSIVSIAAIGLSAFTTIAHAAGWRDTHKELRFGVIPVETQTQTTQSFDAFIAYASEKLGVPVKLFTASEFIGINNALIAKQVEFAWTSPAAFSSSWLDCKCVEPIATATDKDGNLGYNSVLIVKSESSYKTFDDLKGKTIARTEPNSNSGYLVPTVEFAKMGKPIDSYFQSPISGGHTQSVLGVLNGTYEAAFTWTTKEDGYGQLRTMIDKNLLKRDQIRVIWESDLVPPPPVIVHKDMPADLKADLTNFLTSLHKDRPELAEAVAHGKTKGFVPVTIKQYDTTIDALQTMKNTRKRS